MTESFDENTILNDLRAEDLNLLNSLLSPENGFEQLQPAVGQNREADDVDPHELLREIQDLQDPLHPPQNPSSTMSASSSKPSPTGAHPSVQEFAGEFGFQICLDSLTKSSASNSWIYSETLKQVFIKMNHVLNVQFKTSEPLNHNQYFIRAVLVYQNNDFVNHPVNRCSIHWFEDDPHQQAHKLCNTCNCEAVNWAGHVLRCQTNGAIYQYDSQSERHSVSSPVASIDTNDVVSLHYYFACKTSCPRGMQRRSVQMIFTLEDQMSRVFGRRVLPVKICSCPKRDRDRLEKDLKIKAEDEADLSKRFKPDFDEMNFTNCDVTPHATRDNLEAAIAEKFKTQEKELNAAMGLIMNCLQRHNQMEDLVKMIRQKWMAHQ